MQRASAHLTSLYTEATEWLQTHPYGVAIAQPDKRLGGAHPVRVAHDGTPLPATWAAAIGEISHDLRTALDNLICQLGRVRNRAQDCERTGFPIYPHGPRSRERERFRYNSRLIEHLTPGQRRRIERFQPYKRGNGNGASPLWKLHDLNNMDKHRIGLAMAGFGDWLAIRIDEGGFIKGETHIKAGMYLHDGAKVGRIGEHMNVQLFVIPNVVFDDAYPSLRLQPVFPTLQQVGEAVAAIITEFIPDFG